MSRRSKENLAIFVGFVCVLWVSGLQTRYVVRDEIHTAQDYRNKATTKYNGELATAIGDTVNGHTGQLENNAAYSSDNNRLLRLLCKWCGIDPGPLPVVVALKLPQSRPTTQVSIK